MIFGSRGKNCAARMSLYAICFVLGAMAGSASYIDAPAAVRAALLVTPAFQAGRYAMGVYSLKAIATSKLYGALAVIPLFMLWAQVAWIIILTGALFLKVRTRVPPRVETEPTAAT